MSLCSEPTVVRMLTRIVKALFARLLNVVAVVLEETGFEDHTGLGVRISGSATSGTGGSSEAPFLALIKAGCFMWLVRDFEATASPTALTSSSSPVS